jgi:hypothetical protein
VITVQMDNKKQFEKQMNNLVAYSEGFLEGIQKGKKAFLSGVGEKAKDILEAFIDSNARVNPEALHHIYEWYQTGNPDARLFEISYKVSDSGVSLESNFTQSRSVAIGSKEPFYDKARVMESGMSITIRPRSSDYLKFEVGGETVFTPNPVNVKNPGGASTTGAFEKTFNSFFENFFSQSFLESSGLRKSFSDVSIYTKNVKSGMSGGRQIGIAAGQKWIANIELEGR